MFKEYFSIFLYVLPALIVTNHANNLLDEAYEKNSKLQYSITPLGKKNISTPYAKNINFLKNRVKLLEKRNRELF